MRTGEDEVEMIADRIEVLLGRKVRATEALSGGDLSSVVKITFHDGITAVAKSGAKVDVEGRMLQSLAQTGAPVPEVLAITDGILVMSEVPGGASIDWGQVGESLAKLHSHTGNIYGWAEDYAFGAVPIINSWTQTWPDFWAEHRLRVFLPHLPGTMAHRLATLADDLPNRLPQSPKPSLLHGDLWTGNIMAGKGRATLIDPACYYGHSEVDIAMLHLFGQPPQAFYDSYSLEPDWRQRQTIYTLWPVLVHFRLFGSGYLGMVERLLQAAKV